MLAAKLLCFSEPAGPELQEAVGKGTFEHVFSSLEPDTVYSIHLRAYSAEGASQDPASIHASTMGSSEGHPLQPCRAPGLRQTGLPSSSSHFSAAPAALGFSTDVLNATSVQASWELPSQLGPIQGFKLFHCKLPAAHFEGPLLLASTVSSFLYTDLGEALNLLVAPPQCGLAPGTELPGPARPVPFTISCFLQSQPPSMRSSFRHSGATGMVTAVPMLSLCVKCP